MLEIALGSLSASMLVEMLGRESDAMLVDRSDKAWVQLLAYLLAQTLESS